MEHWKNGTAFAEVALSGQDKKSFDEYYFTQTDFAHAPENTKQLMMQQESVRFSMAYMRYGALTWAPTPLSKEQTKILERFANVFEMSYTRFLDIQKAEAQAREAQIEAALERVRAHAMAMHASGELKEVARELRTQLGKLGQKDLETCAIHLYEESPDFFYSWAAVRPPDFGGEIIESEVILPKKGTQLVDEMLEAYFSKEQEYVLLVEGEKALEWFTLLKTHYPEVVDLIIKSRVADETNRETGNGFYFSFADFPGGSLVMVTYTTPDDDSRSLLHRFANVFGIAYRRFADLKKAEAQAREAQIEAALERVRSSTMAMHKSDELLEVIAIVAEQLKLLNYRFDNVSFAVRNQTHDYKFWLSSPGLPKPIHIHVPYINNPMFERVRDVQDDNLGIYTDITNVEESRQWHQHVFENSELHNLPAKTKKYILEHGYARTIILMPTIMLIIGNYASKPYTEEENNVFKRFARVFEQSYTRFLDLQKAEAQAREAQIEAALERVRSSAMAMQSSNDLNTLIGKVFTECTRLDIQLDRGIIMIYDPETRDTRWWMANPEAPDNPRDFLLQYHKHVPYLAFLESWEKRTKKWTYVLEGKEKEDWDAFLFVETELRLLPAEVKQTMTGFKKVYLNASFNSFGNLILATLEPMTDSNFDILLRFARVFDLTYTRFNDLKQAEAQAIEATKQASLDRIRGEIASMRSAKDLEIITPLVWRELTTLGIPFIRCGVFIVHETEEEVEVYLSKPDGTSLAVMHLPFGSSDLAVQTVNAWRKGSIFKQHWSKEEFLNWGRFMIEQGQIPDLDTYQGNEAPPESLFLNFIPFKQGLLYVGTTEPLSDEEFNLSASLAEAFSIAYARYEDFVKLEKAKAAIEETLAELKATQSQLVQQEKLASLGQLTAGIAHEIKNPLNFVTNFSEVSVELVEEAREEVKSEKAKVKNNLPSPRGEGQGVRVCRGMTPVSSSPSWTTSKPTSLKSTNTAAGPTAS